MTLAALQKPSATTSAIANPLLSAPVFPTLIRLSLPNMIAMLATAMVAIAETAYVGAFGTPSLAGLAFVFPMVMLQQMMSSGAMGGGVSSAISRAIGAGQTERASTLAMHAMAIGGLFGVLSTVIFLLFGESIYRVLGAKGAAMSEALAYSNIVFLGATGIWLTNTFASIIRGSGNMKIPSITLLLVATSQIALGGLFGFGWHSVPRLGIAGIAMGQVIAFSCGAIFLFWYLASGRARVRPKLNDIKFRADMFLDILKVGALSCVSPLQSVLTILILTRLVAEFGTEALAGYGIGTRLEFMLIPIAFAVGVACVPMVGMAIGAGNVKRAREVAWTGGLFAAACVGIIGLIVVIWPDIWAAIFTKDAAVLASTRSYFRWVAPFYVLNGLGLCLYFASQGAGKVLGPVLAGTVRLLLVICAGWSLAANHASTASVYALIGVSMAIYGVATAMGIYFVPWGDKKA